MNKQYSRDSEGYLFQPEDWDDVIAHVIAREEGIELNESYGPAINFIRGYFREHDIAPDVRHLITHLAALTMGVTGSWAETA